MYGQVDVVFWSDDVMRAASEDARHFMLYLLTCPHRNRLGAFVLDDYYAAGDVQWSAERVRAARAELEEIGRIQWHPKERVVVLVNWWKRNVLQNQAAAIGGVKELADLPDGRYLVWMRAQLEQHGRAHYRALEAAVEERLRKWRGDVENADESGDVENVVNEKPQEPRENPVNAPVNSRANRSVPNLSIQEPSSSPVTKTEGRSGDDDPPKRGRSESQKADAQAVAELPEPARDALQQLQHPQGQWATARTLRSRFLYDDEGEALGHDSVRGLQKRERVRLVAASVIEMGSQTDTFNPALLAGFIRSLRRAPRPGTEHEQVSKTEQRKPYVPPRDPSSLEPIDYRAILEQNGIQRPRLVKDDDDSPPTDERSA